MPVSPVSSVVADPALDSTASRIPQQTLNQEDFLKLVVTQMSNQDPLNPQTDTAFIAQMAQFTTLEQSKSMQQDMALLNANAVLGRDVVLKDDQGALIEGIVSEVQIDAGTPAIVVNGTPYALSALLSVAPAAAPTQP